MPFPTLVGQLLNPPQEKIVVEREKGRRQSREKSVGLPEPGPPRSIGLRESSLPDPNLTRRASLGNL